METDFPAITEAMNELTRWMWAVSAIGGGIGS
jgi:hypothetical protein